jgi:hypothetical protein
LIIGAAAAALVAPSPAAPARRIVTVAPDCA